MFRQLKSLSLEKTTNNELPFLFLGIFVNTASFSANIEFYCGNFQACVPLLSDLIISPACGNWETLPSRSVSALIVSGQFFPGMQCAFSGTSWKHFCIIFMSWVFTSLFCSMLQVSFTLCCISFAIFCNSFSPDCC